MEDETKDFTLVFKEDQVRLIEVALREYQGWLHDQEYPDGLESHDHEASKKKQECSKLQMMIRESCSELFKVQNVDETEAELSN